MYLIPYVSTHQKYVFYPSHVVDFAPLELHEDLSFEEHPVRFLAREVRKLRNRVIPYLRILWSNHEKCEATWELGSALREPFTHLF